MIHCYSKITVQPGEESSILRDSMVEMLWHVDGMALSTLLGQLGKGLLCFRNILRASTDFDLRPIATFLRYLHRDIVSLFEAPLRLAPGSNQLPMFVGGHIDGVRCHGFLTSNKLLDACDDLCHQTLWPFHTNNA